MYPTWSLSLSCCMVCYMTQHLTLILACVLPCFQLSCSAYPKTFSPLSHWPVLCLMHTRTFLPSCPLQSLHCCNMLQIPWACLQQTLQVLHCSACLSVWCNPCQVRLCKHPPYTARATTVMTRIFDSANGTFRQSFKDSMPIEPKY